MISVVSGTNRKGSECLVFARKYAELLAAQTSEEVKLLALEEVEHDWFHSDMYELNQITASLARLQDEYILAADKFVFFSPEYNGGFAGSLKLFIDGISIRKYTENFKGKKAALVGVATGRAGNLRGMDHLNSVLQHMGCIVMPNKLPISQIGKMITNEQGLADATTIAVMEAHAQEILQF